MKCTNILRKDMRRVHKKKNAEEKILTKKLSIKQKPPNFSMSKKIVSITKFGGIFL